MLRREVSLASGRRNVVAESPWLDRLLSFRDRLLASPSFRRWALMLPFTRPIAHRRARDLFDLCAGFVYSQILLACVRLRLFDILFEGPRTVDELSRRLSLSTDATARLLQAATALRLVERRGKDRFGLGALGAALIGNAGIAAMIEHHPLLYADLRDPLALLRDQQEQTELAKFWSYAGAEKPAALAEEQVAAYTSLMSASQAFIAQEVVDAYSLRGHQCLLDVGGGDGTFLAAVAARASRLRLVLFDLPPVAALAKARFTRDGLGDRASAIEGDFVSDPLPIVADVVSLVRVIHDHDDASALAILRAVHRALPADGVLLVAEPMSGTRGAEPISDAYFGFYLLAMGRGRPRTSDQLGSLLRTAGFDRYRLARTRTPMLTRLIVAQRSASHVN